MGTDMEKKVQTVLNERTDWLDFERPRSMVDQIYKTLGRAIATGGLAPGQVLKEVELQKAFHVSRAPIREAIRLLEADDLVIVDAYKKKYVRLVTRQYVQDLMPAKRGQSRAWALPFVVFASFALGTLLTLLVEQSANPSAVLLKDLRRDARDTFQAVTAIEDDTEKARRLEAGLQRIESKLDEYLRAIEREQEAEEANDG